MSFRTPNLVKGIVDTTTSGSTNYDFVLPQDVDSVTVQVYTGTFTGTSPTLDVYVQTTPDGGATWYDMGDLGQFTAAVTKTAAKFMSFAVAGPARRSASASVTTQQYTDMATGGTSQLTAGTLSGIPILSQRMRIAVVLGGTQVVNAGTVINVYANQSNRA